MCSFNKQATISDSGVPGTYMKDASLIEFTTKFINDIMDNYSISIRNTQGVTFKCDMYYNYFQYL